MQTMMTLATIVIATTMQTMMTLETVVITLETVVITLETVVIDITSQIQKNTETNTKQAVVTKKTLVIKLSHHIRRTTIWITSVDPILFLCCRDMSKTIGFDFHLRI